MAENGNGYVPSRIVELLITNINELSKHIQHLPPMVSRELLPQLERLEEVNGKIITHLSTPPRNQELNDKLIIIDEKVSQHTADVDKRIIKKIDRMITTVKVALAVLASAILLSGAVVHFGKQPMDSNKVDYIVDTLDKRNMERSNIYTEQLRKEVLMDHEKLKMEIFEQVEKAIRESNRDSSPSQ